MKRSVKPTPQTAPPPILSRAHQVRSKCIPLDVPTDREEMLDVLNGERLESPLVNMTLTSGIPVGMPTLRVRERQPSRKARQLAIFLRIDQEMPMIRHQAIGQKPCSRSIHGLFQSSFKGLRSAPQPLCSQGRLKKLTQRLTQKLTCKRKLMLRNNFRRSRNDDLATTDPSIRPNIDDPIRRFDDIHVMFDHDNRVALSN